MGPTLVKQDSLFRVVGRACAQTRSEPGAARPRIVHPDHGLFTPASLFLIELQRWKQNTGGTLEDVAYIIVDWCNFLQSQGAQWNTPSERHYIRWLTPHTPGEGIGGRRRGRKAVIIWRWYCFLETALKDSGVTSFAQAITEQSEGGRAKPRYRAGGSPRLKNGKRPVPSNEQVNMVLDTLASREGYLGERNWLLGRVASQTGLRAMGLYAFTLDRLNELLAVDGVIHRDVCVATLARDRVAKAGIKQRLHALAASGRTDLIVKVTEKRQNTREVAFPIPLVLAMLDFVWGPLASLIAEAKATEDKTKRRLWLGRYAAPLRLGSIKNILGQGFRDANVKGSGQRLRASFLTNKAVDLVRRAKAIHGDKFDSGAIVTELMEIAGHEGDESLRHYVEEARVREALFDAADAKASRSSLRTHSRAINDTADVT